MFRCSKLPWSVTPNTPDSQLRVVPFPEPGCLLARPEAGPSSRRRTRLRPIHRRPLRCPRRWRSRRRRPGRSCRAGRSRPSRAPRARAADRRSAGRPGRRRGASEPGCRASSRSGARATVRRPNSGGSHRRPGRRCPPRAIARRVSRAASSGSRSPVRSASSSRSRRFVSFGNLGAPPKPPWTRSVLAIKPAAA